MRRPGVRAGVIAAVVLLFVQGSWLAFGDRFAVAQARAPAPSTTYFAETGYAISNAAFGDFVARHGGVAIFGFPVSNEFTLQGARVQIFQRFVLQLLPDESVGALNLLDVLPVTHVGGLTLPAPAPEMVASLPREGSADYRARALDALDRLAPNEWRGIPVGFGTAMREGAPCEADGRCDAGVQLTHVLDIWGLPTSAPAVDPNNPSYIYLRTERGVLHYNAATGQTLGLLLGDWFKQVLVGASLPDDLLLDLRGSPYLAQYAWGAPAGLAYPADLPQTSLEGAFGPDIFAVVTARVPPTAVADRGVSRLAPAAGDAAPQNAANAAATLVPHPDLGPFSGRDQCWGGEALVVFPPSPKPRTLTRVSVRAGRRHDPAHVRLTGPVAIQPTVTEIHGPSGYEYEWSFIPPIEGTYALSFYVDGVVECANGSVAVQDGPVAVASSPIATPSQTAPPRPTRTATPRATATSVPTPRATDSPTVIATPILTSTKTAASTATRVPTFGPSTMTPGPTQGAVMTATPTPIATALPTPPPTTTTLPTPTAVPTSPRTTTATPRSPTSAPTLAARRT